MKLIKVKILAQNNDYGKSDTYVYINPEYIIVLYDDPVDSTDPAYRLVIQGDLELFIDKESKNRIIENLIMENLIN